MASADHARTADPLGSIISLLLAFPTMPTPSAFAQHVTPAFYLYPLDDPFVPKYIAFSTCILSWGYKDNPVLQIYIKDVKSFNGTFIKDERLSGEGLESKPFKLKSNNIVVSRSHPLLTSYTVTYGTHIQLGIWHRHCRRRQQNHHPRQGRSPCPLCPQRAGRPSRCPCGATTTCPESTRLHPFKSPPKHDLSHRSQ